MLKLDNQLLGCEATRFYSIVEEKGIDNALTFMKENVIRNYRKAVLDKTRFTSYRRTLIESYLSAKRIVRIYG